MQKKTAPAVADPEGKKEFLDALANGLRLLERFDEETHSVTIQSAAEMLGVTRPASRRILLTLVELGYIQQNDRQFSLASRCIELGYRYFRSLGLAGSARPHLRKLARDLGVGAALGILSGADILFVERVEADRPIKLDLRPGDRLPAYAHSLGRALLAQLPPDQLAAHLPQGAMHQLAQRTVTERRELARELERIRERGWSFVNSELVNGLFGVGIALPASTGTNPIGLNVTSIGEPWTTREIEQRILPALYECAEAMRPITECLVSE